MNHDCFTQNFMTAINVTLLMDNLSEKGNSSRKGNNIRPLSRDE